MKLQTVEHCNDCKHFGIEMNTCGLSKYRQINKYEDFYGITYFRIPDWCKLPEDSDEVKKLKYTISELEWMLDNPEI